MTRRRNKKQIPVNKEQIDIKEIPYYRYIPIKRISDKQINNQQQLAPTFKPVLEPDIEPVKELVNTVNEIQINALDVNQELQQNLEKLYEQQQSIASNEIKNHQLLTDIDTNTTIINNNNEYINQQMLVYNHNINVLTLQQNQNNELNIEANRLTEIINTLNNQIITVQTELQDLNTQIDETQNQLDFHNTMLTSFNNMMQNPQYFMQLISNSFIN